MPTKITGLGEMKIGVELFAVMQRNLNKAYHKKLAEHNTLFVVDPGPLVYPEFIEGLEAAHREEHNCRACADFIERTGHQVFIGANGEIIPAYWDHTVVPDEYKAAIKAIERRVAKGSVMMQFFTDRDTIGTAHDDFPHFSLTHRSLASIVRDDPLVTFEQMGAFSREDHKNLSRSLVDFNITLLRQVKHYLDNDQIPNGQIIQERVEWLIKIQIDLERAVITKPAQRRNILWRYVATAPAGWCAVRGSVLGKFLRMLKEGEEFEVAVAAYKENTKGSNYMRPTAEVTEGNINRAEQVIDALGLRRSLERRFAAFSELPAIWTPKGKAAPAKGEGMFDHLRRNTNRHNAPLPDAVDVQKITFAKFRAKVLPQATKLEFFVKMGKGPYAGTMTAVHADAPPLLQWDDENDRVPFSLYSYEGGSRPALWGLPSEEYVNVVGIVLAPWMQRDEEAYTQHARAAMLVLEAAHDNENDDLALFPNTLRRELHEIRATIEAFSNNTNMGEVPEGQLAQGVLIAAVQKNMAYRVRVTSETGTAVYVIDRWD